MIPPTEARSRRLSRRSTRLRAGAIWGNGGIRFSCGLRPLGRARLFLVPPRCSPQPPSAHTANSRPIGRAGDRRRPRTTAVRARTARRGVGIVPTSKSFSAELQMQHLGAMGGAEARGKSFGRREMGTFFKVHYFFRETSRTLMRYEPTGASIEFPVAYLARGDGLGTGTLHE